MMKHHRRVEVRGIRRAGDVSPPVTSPSQPYQRPTAPDSMHGHSCLWQFAPTRGLTPPARRILIVALLFVCNSLSAQDPLAIQRRKAAPEDVSELKKKNTDENGTSRPLPEFE